MVPYENENNIFNLRNKILILVTVMTNFKKYLKCGMVIVHDIEFVGVRVYVCMYVRVCVCMYVCMYVRTCVCMYVRMYICMYVRTYVYMYVCMYCVCMCVCVCMYVCIAFFCGVI